MSNQTSFSVILILLSTLLMISSSSWLFLWVMMEINTMSFVTFMMNKKNPQHFNSLMIYFVTQSTASMIFLFSILLTKVNPLTEIMNSSLIISSLILFSLLLKLGFPPLHSWVVKIGINCKKNILIMILTWQKIIPLIMISNMSFNFLIFMLIPSSAFLSLTSQFMINSPFLIMIISSMFHLSWMISAIFFSTIIFCIYMAIYSILLSIILKIMKEMKMNNFVNKLKMNQLNMSILILSMAGIPPLLGFTPKWFIVKFSNSSFFFFIIFILIIFTAISFFIYARMIFSIWLIPPLEMKNLNLKKISKFTIILNLMLPFLILYL